MRAELLQSHLWFVRKYSTALAQLILPGLLKHSKSDSSADSFMPLLIYVVLQANPEHLVSNVQYILRFRNQDKLVGEAGYYLSSLVSRDIYTHFYNYRAKDALDGRSTIYRKLRPDIAKHF
jgi:hypothetical protein